MKVLSIVLMVVCYGALEGGIASKKGHDQRYKHDDFESVFNVSYYPGLYIPEHYDFVVNKNTVSQDPKYLKNKDYYDDLARRYGQDLEKNKHAPISVRYINKDVGYGLFADKKINKDELVAEYTGTLIQYHEKEDENAYLFTYPGTYFDAQGEEYTFFIDAKKQGNTTRFANHSEKNVNLKAIEVPYKGRWYIAYIAKKTIPKNKQLLVSYGAAYWKNTKKPAELKP